MDSFTPHFLGNLGPAIRAAIARLYAKIGSHLRCGRKIASTDLNERAKVTKNVLPEYSLLRQFVTSYSGHRASAILAFGDSVYMRVASDDLSSQSLSSMLSNEFGDRIFQVYGSGYHAQIFELFSRVLATLPERPDVVIIPVNMRSFSPTWDLSPLYQFRAETNVLSSFSICNPDFRLQHYNADLSEEFLSFIMSCGDNESMMLREFLDIAGTQPERDSDEWEARLKCIFRYHYTCPLRGDNRKLQSLVNTVGFLINLGVRVYCYITPINHEAGTEYCGASFTTAVRNNISVVWRGLRAAASPHKGMFRFDDFSCRLSRDVFFSPHNSTEHLRLAGRQFLTQSITGVVESVTNDTFSDNEANQG